MTQTDSPAIDSQSDADLPYIQPPCLVVAYADAADTDWLDRLDAASSAESGTRLALAQPHAISVFEGEWPGGAVGVWRFAQSGFARSAAAKAGMPGPGGFALSIPERPGALPPGPGAGLMLVQGLFTDSAKAAVYNQALPPIYARHGGWYLALSRPEAITCLAGDWTPKAIVVAAFGSPESSSRFWRSDEYSAAKSLRAGGGHFLVVAFPAI